MFIAYSFWSFVIFLVNECVAMPNCRIPADFIELSRRFLGPSIGFATGYNYCLCMIGLLCFEITNFGDIISFWTPLTMQHNAAIITVLIITYGIMHLWDAKWFGESEFVSLK